MNNNQDEFIRLDCPRCGAPLQNEGDHLTCQHCGAKLILKQSVTNQRTSSQNYQDAGVVVNNMPLKPFAYYDPQSCLEAFSILVPQG